MDQHAAASMTHETVWTDLDARRCRTKTSQPLTAGQSEQRRQVEGSSFTLTDRLLQPKMLVESLDEDGTQSSFSVVPMHHN